MLFPTCTLFWVFRFCPLHDESKHFAGWIYETHPIQDGTHIFADDIFWFSYLIEKQKQLGRNTKHFEQTLHTDE